MSRIKYTLNFFFKNNWDNNNNTISSQKIYTLYKISLKLGFKITLLEFCILLIRLLFLKKNLFFSVILLCLSFLKKTLRVLIVRLYKNKKQNININSVFTAHIILPLYKLNGVFNSFKLYVFWLKFRWLLRPKLKDNEERCEAMELFLKRWRERTKIYIKLKIVRFCCEYHFIHTNSGAYIINLGFLKKKIVNIVYTTKFLLKIPKLTSSSIVKYIDISKTDVFEFQFLRKNKVYNKGRYSRCRQNYRTGVYMCMYLSIVSVFGLYYWFFKFSLNFTYLWWLFICLIGSIFLPKMVKFRLYEPLTFLNKFFDFFKWILLISKSIFM